MRVCASRAVPCISSYRNWILGPIIAQAAVPVLASDDEETLAARTLEAEHKLYPMALGLLAHGLVKLEGASAVFAAMPANTGVLFNPAL